MQILIEKFASNEAIHSASYNSLFDSLVFYDICTSELLDSQSAKDDCTKFN
jgi:ribonucleotide reductase beta subunit family protein with ferritin-like domain